MIRIHILGEYLKGLSNMDISTLQWGKKQHGYLIFYKP